MKLLKCRVNNTAAMILGLIPDHCQFGKNFIIRPVLFFIVILLLIIIYKSITVEVRRCNELYY